MSSCYLTTILFTSSELAEINSTESPNWGSYITVNKVLNFLKCLNTIESKGGHLSDDNKKFFILVYSNYRTNYSKFHNLVKYINDKLACTEDEDKVTVKELENNAAEGTQENYLTNLGIYRKDPRKCNIWLDTIDDNLRIKPVDSDANENFTSYNPSTFSRANSILFFNNDSYKRISVLNTNVYTKKGSHPNALQHTRNRTKNRREQNKISFVNRNFVIFSLLKNITNVTAFEKVLYIDNNYTMTYEGFHNYLQVLSNEYTFIVSPNYHGDIAKGSDLIDGFSNNFIGYNNSNLSDANKDTVFKKLLDLCRKYNQPSTLNGDSLNLRRSMTQIFSYMFSQKLINNDTFDGFKFYYTLPITLFCSEEMFSSLENNNHCIKSNSFENFDLENNYKVEARILNELDIDNVNNADLSTLLANSLGKVLVR